MTINAKGRGPARAAVALAVVLGGLASMVTASHAGTVSPKTKELLQSSSYIYIATQRQDGSVSEAVPIWFMWDGEASAWAAKTGSDEPVIQHVHFTGTGTRTLTDAGKAAIAALFERSFR